jgi:hypothetical protein
MRGGGDVAAERGICVVVLSFPPFLLFFPSCVSIWGEGEERGEGGNVPIRQLPCWSLHRVSE